MENSEPQGRWVQPVALHEHVLRTRPQPNARPARTRRYEPQAPYPAPLEPGLDRVSRSNRRSVAFPNRLELREVTYRLGLPTDFANAPDRSHEVPEELGCASSGSFRCKGDIASAVNRLYEGAFFAKDDAFSYRCLEVLARLRIGFQLLSVRFIRCKAVEGNQSPGNIVSPLVGQEVAHQTATTPRDDAAPVFSVLFESFPLVRIDFVSDETCYCHMFVTGRRACEWRGRVIFIKG